MKKVTNLIRPVAALGILLIFLAGCASPDQGRTAEEYLDDQTVNARVKTSLLGDEIVRGRSVSTTTFEGIVQLSGFVDHETERMRAEEVARGVDGVREVINNIEIKPTATEYGNPGERERSTPRRPAPGEFDETSPEPEPEPEPASDQGVPVESETAS